MRWRWHHDGEEEGRGGSRWTSSLGGSPPGGDGGGEEEGGDGDGDEEGEGDFGKPPWG